MALSEQIVIARHRTEPPPIKRAAAKAPSPTNDALMLAAIVESSHDAIISKDLNGIIRSWNKGAQEIFGYEAHEAIGKPITMLMPDGQKQEEAEILARLRRGERMDHYETIRRRKDGSLVNISLTVSPLKDDEGRIVGASKIARDITERKRAEETLRKTREELARANEELEERVKVRTASLNEAIGQMEEFSYSVSHDLRGPLRAMQGYALALLQDYSEGLDDRGRDYLERIVRSSQRMDRLILDVLSYSRVARAEIELRPISLETILGDIIRHYPELQSPRAGVSLETPMARVMAHEASLAQALANLLGNAAKFVAQGVTPRIQTWTETRDGWVRLYIKDNGIGIPPKYQARIFRIFERAHSDPRYEGTGIGLAIVRKAIEKMGGQVGVESNGTNGSIFWLDLPAVEKV